MGCVFCNRSELEREIFFESRNFMLVYNLKPILPGHSLIVPKKHVETLSELSQEELEELVGLMKKFERVLKDAYHGTGFNFAIQEGPESGATIRHLHVHLIPRRESDVPNPSDWYALLIGKEHREETISPEEMKEQIEKIKAVIK